MVPKAQTPVKLSIVTLHLNHAFPPFPSRIIPVVEVLVPFIVRKIDFMNIAVLDVIGTISNALAMKNIQNIPKKKSVAHLMKPNPLLFVVCKFLLVKVIVII